jgi:CO/xanthine dehydrogenase FAD-binding subunit
VRPEAFADRKIVIDISGVPELRGIELTADKQIRIGACVTHQEVADHPLIQRRARLLGLACGSIGSLQIRNRGTIGGNLGNASPAGDSIPALTCLDARVELGGRDRARSVPVLELFEGPGQLRTGPDELITAVRVPVRKGRTVAFFKKAGLRKGMSCSKASVAFCARRHGDGRLTGVRVALGAVAPTVIMVPGAQEALEDRLLSPGFIREAAAACVQAARPIDDIRSTAEYRRQVVGGLLTEGLLEILDHMRSLRKSRRRSRS